MRSALVETAAQFSAVWRSPTLTPPQVVSGATQKSTADAGAALSAKPSSSRAGTRSLCMGRSSALPAYAEMGAAADSVSASRQPRRGVDAEFADDCHAESRGFESHPTPFPRKRFQE